MPHLQGNPRRCGIEIYIGVQRMIGDCPYGCGEGTADTNVHPCGVRTSTGDAGIEWESGELMTSHYWCGIKLDKTEVPTAV